jgi:hypothetical protein
MAQESMHCWNRKRSEVRFPLPGLNDNLDFLGTPLHVQTESVEFPVACIVTQVFCKGKVILSKKSERPFEIQDNIDAAKMQELMRAQHTQIIQSITEKQARIRGNR